MLMHIKVLGFTITELVVTIGISVVLAAIAIPSVMTWYKKDEFLRQTQEVLDTLNDARASALSEKNCPSGDPSESWTWDINNNEGVIRLACLSTPESLPASTYYFPKEFTLDENVEINDIAYKTTLAEPWTPLATDTKNGIAFLSSSSGNSKGWITGPVTGFDVRKVKFTFRFPEDTDIVRTICFDRIAGFPSISTTLNCDD